METSATPSTEPSASNPPPPPPDSTSVPPASTGLDPTPESTRARPRLNLTGERKRGKSMFGLVLGTLNKAKIEEKERDASEAAKKRHLIEQRLQLKLRRETDSVRRQEDAKRDKTSANRREEDLSLADSIYKLRRTHLPLLANFLITSDVITSDSEDPPEMASRTDKEILAPPPRSHPPPLYYLPVILTPSQQSFLDKRKSEVNAAANREWLTFKEERTKGNEEIIELRKKVAEANEDRDKSREEDKDAMDVESSGNSRKEGVEGGGATTASVADSMDVDTTEVSKIADAQGKEDLSPAATRERSEKEEIQKEVAAAAAAIQADDDDAVEY